MGVILFTMVTGVMPYFEARTDDPLYSMILARNSEAYWEKWNEIRQENQALTDQGDGKESSEEDVLQELESSSLLKEILLAV